MLVHQRIPPKNWDFQTLCLIFIPCGMSPPWLHVHGPPRRRPRASRAKAHGSRASVGRRANTTPELGPETCGTKDFSVELLSLSLSIYIYMLSPLYIYIYIYMGAHHKCLNTWWARYIDVNQCFSFWVFDALTNGFVKVPLQQTKQVPNGPTDIILTNETMTLSGCQRPALDQ